MCLLIVVVHIDEKAPQKEDSSNVTLFERASTPPLLEPLA
jgi:hypothetical protein